MAIVQRLSLLSAACVLAGLHATAQADFVTVPVASGSTTTLTTCNPKVPARTGTSSSTLTTCKVNGLPGSTAVPGYILKSSTSSSITINSVNIGTLYDRVWCKGSGTTCDSSNTYILGTRANLNTNVWSGTTTESFEINDFFRTVLSGSSVDVAYFMGTSGGTTADTSQAFKYLEYSGRTVQGLNEGSGTTDTVKATSNGWISLRADSNANDSDGISSAWSPWLLVRQVCPSGYNATQQTMKARLWQGGEEGQIQQAILKSAYVCN